MKLTTETLKRMIREELDSMSSKEKPYSAEMMDSAFKLLALEFPGPMDDGDRKRVKGELKVEFPQLEDQVMSKLVSDAYEEVASVMGNWDL